MIAPTVGANAAAWTRAGAEAWALFPGEGGTRLRGWGNVAASLV